MNPDPEQHNCATPKNPIIEKPLSPTGSLVAIYTGLLILLKMRKALGLEAMLDYMENYARIIGSANPHVQAAVTKALQKADIPKIYREAMGRTND